MNSLADVKQIGVRVEQLLGGKCLLVEPLAYGADPHSRVARVFVERDITGEVAPF